MSLKYSLKWMLGGNIMHNKIHEIKSAVVQIVLREDILWLF